MTEKDSLTYAPFWARMTGGVLIFIFLGSLVFFCAALYASVANDARPGMNVAVSGGIVALCLFYLRMRRKYPHMKTVDAKTGGKPPQRIRLLRFILLAAPLAVFAAPVIYAAATAIQAGRMGVTDFSVAGAMTASVSAYLEPTLLCGIFWAFWFALPALLSPQRKSLPEYITSTAVVYPDDGPQPPPQGATAGAACAGKAALSVLAVLFIAAQAWLGLLYFFNTRPRAPDPMLAARMTIKDFNADDNFYAALRSIHAPAVSMDRYGYGLRALQGMGIDPRVQAPEEQSEVHWQPGPPARSLQQTYDDNAQLITRFQALYHQSFDNYTRTFNPAETESYGDLPVLQDFMAQYWPKMAEKGDGDAALQDWIANGAFTRGFLSHGLHTLAEQDLWQRLYRVNLSALPAILQANPALAAKNRDALLAALQTGESGLSNIKDCMTAELVTAKPALNFLSRNALFNENDTYSQMLALSRDAEKLDGKSDRGMVQGLSALQKKYDCKLAGLPLEPLLGKCIYNPTGRGYVFTLAQNLDVFTGQYALRAMARADALLVKARAQDIPAAKMADFIAQQGKELTDPVTEKPFAWNEKSSCIAHADKLENCLAAFTADDEKKKKK
ncbi:MAG: hypothetical protein GC185_02010 [Alphaproteobacteria bacterium]|nr:hypothetical protein [Alphaproteobacteria bacterium]